MSRKNKLIGSAEFGCPDGWQRVTIIERTIFHQAMKMIAWYDRKNIQDVYDDAIYDYIEKQKDRGEQIRKAYEDAKEETENAAL